MKIYYYAGIAIHPFYQEQFHTTPSGFDKCEHSDLPIAETIRKDYRWWYQLRKPLEGFNRWFRSYVPILNLHTLPKKNDFNLCHSGQRLLNGEFLYVTDFEQIGAFAFHSNAILNHPIFRKKLLLHLKQPRLKFLLPWTEKAQKSLCTWCHHDPEIIKKCRVVYPAIRPKKLSVSIKNTEIRLLFVGGHFFYKGGLETIELWKKILKHHKNFHLDIVSQVPEKHKSEYTSLKNIQFYEKISNQQLEELYQKAHILIMPQHTDTLGWVIFEAYSRGIPVLSCDNFSIKELIEHQKTGFITKNPVSFWDENGLQRYNWWQDADFYQELKEKCLDSDYISQLYEGIEFIIQNHELLRKEVLHLIQDGKFSFKKRNHILSEIYHQALS